VTAKGHAISWYLFFYRQLLPREAGEGGSKSILTDIYMGSDGLLGVLDRLWMSAGGGDDFLGMTMEALRDGRSLL
jgi:hypothetical protein